MSADIVLSITCSECGHSESFCVQQGNHNLGMVRSVAAKAGWQVQMETWGGATHFAQTRIGQDKCPTCLTGRPHEPIPGLEVS